MRLCLRTTTLASLLAVSTSFAPLAHAGAAPQLNSSQVSVLVTASLVLSIPLAMSMGLARASEATGEASRRSDGKREKAGPLPPMEVKAIEPAADGGHAVRLQVPDAPDQHATLQWPQGAPAPASRFEIGDVVYLDPTDTGAGWNVKDDDGQLLAFVPTAAAAADNGSQAW